MDIHKDYYVHVWVFIKAMMSTYGFYMDSFSHHEKISTVNFKNCVIYLLWSTFRQAELSAAQGP